jgi:hypothetical protein
LLRLNSRFRQRWRRRRITPDTLVHAVFKLHQNEELTAQEALCFECSASEWQLHPGLPRSTVSEAKVDLPEIFSGLPHTDADDEGEKDLLGPKRDEPHP